MLKLSIFIYDNIPDVFAFLIHNYALWIFFILNSNIGPCSYFYR
jgi:hypothetical protein